MGVVDCRRLKLIMRSRAVMRTLPKNFPYIPKIAESSGCVSAGLLHDEQRQDSAFAYMEVCIIMSHTTTISNPDLLRTTPDHPSDTISRAIAYVTTCELAIYGMAESGVPQGHPICWVLSDASELLRGAQSDLDEWLEREIAFAKSTAPSDSEEVGL